jgi:pantoate--beta-alanine ligase
MTEVVHTRAELRAITKDHANTGLIPTMGALHHGHASLVQVAREAGGGDLLTVVSIFVNPLQFAPQEDLTTYPRTFEQDLALCRELGVELVFAPSAAEMYPAGEPTVTSFAVFGEKDFQQLALIQRMAQDLCQGVKIVSAPTIREPDGLAMSSRNRYLNQEERQNAVGLSATLQATQSATIGGLDQARAAGLQELQNWPAVKLHYLELRAPDLSPLPAKPESGTVGRALIAAEVGKTRLIDNMAVTF